MPACWRASPSRPATRRPTRSRRRPSCATSVCLPARPACRWARRRPSSRRECPACWPTCNDGAMPSPNAPSSEAPEVRLTFLGGLGEIGRNCLAIEQDGRLLLIDCGLMFPDADMHGIDLVLPDFTWLHEHSDQIEAVVATHGHEDHVGALPFLLREHSFPIYGSAVTLGLARHRIEEAGLLGNTDLVIVADGERRQIGPFDVEFIPVTHSVPHAHAIAVHTPQGVILHSGDFKLDLTPVDGRRTDLARIGELAKGPGIRVLLADSTNAEEAGHAPSETSVG